MRTLGLPMPLGLLTPLLVFSVLATLLAVPLPLAAQPTGWRLIMPPVNDEGRVFAETPRSGWAQHTALDRAVECEAMRSELLRSGLELRFMLTSGRVLPEYRSVARSLSEHHSNALCVPF